MPRPSSLHLFPALLFAACTTGGDHGHDHPTHAEEGPVDMEAAMARQMAYATPGEEHAKLAERVGSWKAEGASYWEPGGEPQPMVATAEVETLLGGRILKETFRTEFEGMPFEGMLLLGYDKMKGEYWSVWYDSMSTWGGHSTGGYEESGRFVMEGTMRDAMTPDGRLVRTVVTELDPDHHEWRMYDVWPDGSETLTMELTYTRVP